MIVHNFDPVLIDLGLFQIRWYSIAYILGIIIGWIYAIKIIKLTRKNKYNFETIKGRVYITGITSRKEQVDNLIEEIENIKGVNEIVNYVIIKESKE